LPYRQNVILQNHFVLSFAYVGKIPSLCIILPCLLPYRQTIFLANHCGLLLPYRQKLLFMNQAFGTFYLHFAMSAKDSLAEPFIIPSLLAILHFLTCFFPLLAKLAHAEPLSLDISLYRLFRLLANHEKNF